METALDPFEPEMVTVAQYVARHGRRMPGVVRAAARCPVCRQPMTAMGDGTANTVGHFAHRKGAGFCPTREAAQAPYLALPPSFPDPDRGRWLREVVRSQADQHLAVLQQWATYLGPEELDEMLAIAARRRLWEYRHLQPWQVPFCLLMTREFPPWTSARSGAGQPIRRLWFRFWFDSGVRGIDDLWIHREGKVHVHRGSYLPPSGRRALPGLADLQRVTSEPISPLALPGSPLKGTANFLNMLRGIMARHLA